MTTTIRLDESLLTEANICAPESGRTLTAVLEDAVRETLARRREAGGCKPVRLKTLKVRGLHNGVRLDDSASLLELMEH